MIPELAEAFAEILLADLSRIKQEAREEEREACAARLDELAALLMESDNEILAIGYQAAAAVIRSSTEEA